MPRQRPKFPPGSESEAVGSIQLACAIANCRGAERPIKDVGSDVRLPIRRSSDEEDNEQEEEAGKFSAVRVFDFIQFPQEGYGWVLSWIELR